MEACINSFRGPVKEVVEKLTEFNIQVGKCNGRATGFLKHNIASRFAAFL